MLQSIISAFHCVFMPAIIPLISLRIQREVNNDTWNQIENGDVWCNIFTEDQKRVGHIDYRVAVGQIGGIFLEEPFRRRGLEQQLLIYAMHDMKVAGAKVIWEVVPDEKKWGDRPFYSELWDFRYKSQDVHPSVTGCGYIMDIPDRPHDLPYVPGAGIY